VKSSCLLKGSGVEQVPFIENLLQRFIITVGKRNHGSHNEVVISTHDRQLFSASGAENIPSQILHLGINSIIDGSELHRQLIQINTQDGIMAVPFIECSKVTGSNTRARRCLSVVFRAASHIQEFNKMVNSLKV
jgi:hypothetical protein